MLERSSLGSVCIYTLVMQRQLSQIGRALRMVPLWYTLLSAWDGMQGGMINGGRLSPSVGLVLPALLVFIRTEDGKPYKITDTWRCAGINHTHDIIHRCAQGRQSY
jgi:hypothetical protein